GHSGTRHAFTKDPARPAPRPPGAESSRARAEWRGAHDATPANLPRSVSVAAARSHLSAWLRSPKGARLARSAVAADFRSRAVSGRVRTAVTVLWSLHC